MNDNVGENIKNHAQRAFFIGVVSIIIFSVIFAVVAIDSDFEDVWYVPLIMAPFAIAAQWTVCLLIYGFGQLIENTNPNNNTEEVKSGARYTVAPDSPMGRLLANSESATNTQKRSASISDTWCCMNCGKQNPKHIKTCECGYKKAY